MSGRVFDGQIARAIAHDDRAREERLKATARALVTAVRDGLVRDGAVRLHGFGTFRLRPVAARRGRHPRTGEPIDIPAGWRVMFRPAKALRERIEPDQAPALLIGEPHASREAMLDASAAAAAHAIGRSAGRIPAEGVAPPPPPASEPEPEPGRVAAAAMPEAKLSVHGPIPGGPGSDLEADCRVTRSPAALTRAPAANEPPPVEEAVGKAPEAPVEQTATGRPRRHGNRSTLLLVVLLLILAGLAWLFRPGPPPAPPVAEDPGAATGDQAPADAASGNPGTGATVDADAAAVRDSAPGDKVQATGTAGTGTGGDEERPDETVVASATGATSTDAPAVPPPSVEAPDTDDPDVTPGTMVSATTADIQTAGAGSGATVEEVRTDITAAGDNPDASEAVESARASTGADSAADDAADKAASGGGPYFSGREHTVRAGDTLWDLADRNYVNPYYWPHIWNHNGDIANPDRLEVRQGLWLPTLEGEPRSLTEADRRSIAEGYLRLYRFFLDQGDANPQYALVGVRYFDASVLPERMQGTAAGHPADTLAAVFQARLEAEFPLE